MNAYYHLAPGGYYLAFAYDPMLVDLLKSTVPPNARRWKPDNKEWYIAAHAWDDLVHDFSEYDVEFIDITEKLSADAGPKQPQKDDELRRRIAAVEERERAVNARENALLTRNLDLMRREADIMARASGGSAGASPEYKLLHLQSDAPREVVEAAYRALVKLHHPDRGGSNDRMARINAAFDKVKSWR